MTNTNTLSPNKSSDFKKIYEKTAPLLLYVAGQLGIARDEREDLSQQAYMKLIECKGEFTIEQAKAYLTRTVRSLVIDRSRRAKVRKTESVGDWSVVAERPMWSSDGENDAAVSAVHAALDSLAAKGEAETLVLFYRDGLSVEEIRSRTGGATGTVTAKLCRQRQRHAASLRTAVEEALASHAN